MPLLSLDSRARAHARAHCLATSLLLACAHVLQQRSYGRSLLLPRSRCQRWSVRLSRLPPSRRYRHRHVCWRRCWVEKRILMRKWNAAVAVLWDPWKLFEGEWNPMRKFLYCVCAGQVNWKPRKDRIHCQKDGMVAGSTTNIAVCWMMRER